MQQRARSQFVKRPWLEGFSPAIAAERIERAAAMFSEKNG
jgi:hypothetical protein